MNLNAVRNRKIIVSVLDWGMGHLTRTSVLVKQLLEQQNEITFAGNEFQIEWMNREFPQVTTVHLKGYNVQLNPKRPTYLQLLRQYNQLKDLVNSENVWLTNWLSQNTCDLIISDNRYGFYNPKCHSVLVTHQLELQVPAFKSWVNKNLRKWINRFHEVWIPDQQDRKLTRQLTNSAGIIVPVSFVGYLSRFTIQEPVPTQIDKLILISGPEPARSQFAERLKLKYTHSPEQIVFVGCDSSNTRHRCIQNPDSQLLNQLIQEAALIISRAGYTTLMELHAMQKNAILIPTPGQYEQIYLARIAEIPGIKFISEADFFSA